MVSITLSVSEDIKKQMHAFNDINWSAFVRNCIIEKTKTLNWKKEMLERWEKEKNENQWTLDLERKIKKGRSLDLKKKGLL